MQGKKQQIEFVDAMFDDLKVMFVAKIQKGLIPSEWDGHELRQWITDVAKDQIAGNMAVGKDKRSSRYKDYEHVYLLNTLYKDTENCDFQVLNENDD